MSSIDSEGFKEKSTQSSAWMLRFAMGLILCALCIAAYLLLVSHGDGIGCGAKFGCGAVLQSSWSMWRGIPVAAIALATYGGILAGTLILGFGRLSRGSRLVEAVVHYLAVVVLLAAIWFFLVQVISLKELCPWCLTAHLSGSAAAVILLWIKPWGRQSVQPKAAPESRLHWVMGIITVAVLVIGQITERSAGRNLRIVRGTLALKVMPDGIRTLAFNQSELFVTVGEDPLLGDHKASRLAVLFFDFTCPQCRRMHVHLVELLPRYERQLAVVCLPVPLESSCNHLVRVNRRPHLHACEYARLAIAVWKTDKKAYAEFDRIMFTAELPPSIEQAKNLAQMLIGGDRLSQALEDKRVNELIARNVALYHGTFNVTGSDALPQLHMDNYIVLGLVENQEDILRFLGKNKISD